MIHLPQTSRLILFSLDKHPNQTFADLMTSTGTRHAHTMRENLRLVQVANLVTKSTTRPATFALITQEAADEQ